MTSIYIPFGSRVPFVNRSQLKTASNAEAQAKTATARVLTPANLAALAASATFSGMVELATDAEAIAGTDTARAVTPHALGSALANMDIISFSGKNGAGACTAAGLAVGDIIRSVTGLAAATVGDQSGKFESTVTVADQIQQSDEGDLSSNVYMALVYRQS